MAWAPPSGVAATSFGTAWRPREGTGEATAGAVRDPPPSPMWLTRPTGPDPAASRGTSRLRRLRHSSDRRGAEAGQEVRGVPGVDDPLGNRLEGLGAGELCQERLGRLRGGRAETVVNQAQSTATPGNPATGTAASSARRSACR